MPRVGFGRHLCLRHDSKGPTLYTPVLNGSFPISSQKCDVIGYDVKEESTSVLSLSNQIPSLPWSDPTTVPPVPSLRPTHRTGVGISSVRTVRSRGGFTPFRRYGHGRPDNRFVSPGNSHEPRSFKTRGTVVVTWD